MIEEFNCYHVVCLTENLDKWCLVPLISRYINAFEIESCTQLECVHIQASTLLLIKPCADSTVLTMPVLEFLTFYYVVLINYACIVFQNYSIIM